MRDAARALGRDVPDVERGGHELVGFDVVDRRQSGALSFGAALGPVEPTLARDDDAFGGVAEHRVGRAAERTPRAVARRALTLAPNDFAAQQQVQTILQDRHDVGGQAAVRLATEVRDVDCDTTAGFELVCTLGEDVGEELQVLGVRRGYTFAFELLFVLLARVVGRRRDDERDRAVGDRVHVARVAFDEGIGDLVRRDYVVGV